MYDIPIERGKIREFAIAVKASDPAHFAPDAVIPPTFLTIAGLGWEPTADQPELDLDLTRTLHGSEEYEYFGELPRAGQTLTVTTSVADQFERNGGRGGTLRFAVVLREFREPSGRLVATQRTTAIELTHSPTKEQ